MREGINVSVLAFQTLLTAVLEAFLKQAEDTRGLNEIALWFTELGVEGCVLILESHFKSRLKEVYFDVLWSIWLCLTYVAENI